MSPSYSESISFINFIASMMQSTCPFLTVVPTSTNGGGARLGRTEERADDRRLHNRKIDLVGRMVAWALGTASRGGGGRCGRLRDRRRCLLNHRHRERSRRVHEHALLYLDLEAFSLELELAQLVLAHHLENAVDLVKVHASM